MTESQRIAEELTQYAPWIGGLGEELMSRAAAHILAQEQEIERLNKELDSFNASMVMAANRELRGDNDKAQDAEARRVDELTKELAALKGQEPVQHQFQARDGTWFPFHNEAHYKNTVESGQWPIRALYLAAGART